MLIESQWPVCPERVKKKFYTEIKPRNKNKRYSSFYSVIFLFALGLAKQFPKFRKLRAHYKYCIKKTIKIISVYYFNV